MLRSLHIENVAVIRRADLEFDHGFSVLTGETGAGKSMIIDSVNLLLGNRVPKDMVRTGESQAVVSAVFDELTPAAAEKVEALGFSVEDGSLMLQRTLGADGKSRTRLNGQVITQSVQREIARALISIHGQNDSQRILQKETHLELLDAYCRPDAELAGYREAYDNWREKKKKWEAISQSGEEKVRLAEILHFQIDDIDRMKLREGEEEALIRERDRLLHAEQINKQVHLAYRALRGGEKTAAIDLINRAEGALHTLSGLVEGTDALADRLSAAASEIFDVAETVLSFAEDENEDPTPKIDRIEGRLESISKLKRKYGPTVGDILAFRAKAAEKLDELEFSDEAREKLQKEMEDARIEAEKRAMCLRAIRRRAAGEIREAVTESLSFLDMPKVRFDVRITPCPLIATGADDVEFLIATNPGEPLQPMIRIASGGELSRIMLALRSVLHDREGTATVIFDEIDTGISGKTSRKVGIRLKESAQGAQVICITHSAQIASLADTHFRISKTERNGRAETDVEILDEKNRVEEIARILGGIQITDAQRAAAAEMIREYR